MSNWILYDDFVDRVKSHHHNAFSGLITGVSDSRHSFQVGFDHGEIVLLTYRVKKGLDALPLITKIARAKISEHPNGDIQDVTGEALDTGAILSRLTANTFDETTTQTTRNDDQNPPRTTGKTTAPRALDARLKKVIEAAAVRHFGPIGAMVCEQRLTNADGDVAGIMQGIAREIGASEADTRAFFQSVAGD